MINAKHADRITNSKEPYLMFKNSIYSEIYKAMSYNMKNAEWNNYGNSNCPEEDVEDVKSICNHLEDLGYKTKIEIKKDNYLVNTAINVRISW